MALLCSLAEQLSGARGRYRRCGGTKCWRASAVGRTVGIGTCSSPAWRTRLWLMATCQPWTAAPRHGSWPSTRQQESSRRRDCHFDDTPCFIPIKAPNKCGVGCSRMTALADGHRRAAAVSQVQPQPERIQRVRRHWPGGPRSARRAQHPARTVSSRPDSSCLPLALCSPASLLLPSPVPRPPSLHPPCLLPSPLPGCLPPVPSKRPDSAADCKKSLNQVPPLQRAATGGDHGAAADDGAVVQPWRGRMGDTALRHCSNLYRERLSNPVETPTKGSDTPLCHCSNLYRERLSNASTCALDCSSAHKPLIAVGETIILMTLSFCPC